MKTRSRAGAAALLATAAIAGALSARALAQIDPPPLPTVSVPSVSLPVPPPPLPRPPAPPPPPSPSPSPAPSPAPLPPAPLPPAPSLPTPPSPSAPAVPSASPPAAPVPVGSAPPAAAPGAPAPAQPAGARAQPWQSWSDTYFSYDRRRRPAGQASVQSRTGVTRLGASPRRFKAGAKRRGTRITFRLTDPARVVFVVRGPAPSCEVVGRFSVRGRAGLNRIRFKGRVGRRTLRPGTYAITAHPAGKEQQGRRIVVMIGTQPRRRLDCAVPMEFSLAAELPSFVPPTGGTTSKPTRPTAQPAAKEEEPTQGVLPAVRRKFREIREAIPPIPNPPAPRDVADSPPAIIGIGALGLLALSALAILFYVIRFLRGPGTTSA